MTHTARIPIACRLSEPELRERQATLIAQIRSAIVTREELSEGYLFHLPGDKKTLTLITELIAAERECCPFLTFELTFLPNLGPLVVRITGPDGSRDLLRPLFQDSGQ